MTEKSLHFDSETTIYLALLYGFITFFEYKAEITWLNIVRLKTMMFRQIKGNRPLKGKGNSKCFMCIHTCQSVSERLNNASTGMRNIACCTILS